HPACREALASEWFEIAAPGVGTMRAAVARPAGRGPFPAIVLLHGTHGFAPEYVQLAHALAQGGVVAGAPCWFKGGGGPGAGAVSAPIACPQAPPLPDATSPGALRTVTALMAATRSLPGVRADGVALFGHSRGGGAALHYALTTRDVPALVLDSSGYPDPVDDLATRLEPPVLVLHGTADGADSAGSSFTSIDRARAFESARRRAGRPGASRYYEGAGHNGIFADPKQGEDSVRRMIAFLDARLGGAARGGADSWPQFRGPAANPVGGPSLPDRWSATDNVDSKHHIPHR